MGLVDDYPVREAVGALLYLEEMTRPDLGNAVRDLCSFVSHTTQEVVLGIEGVFRYLAETIDKKVYISGVVRLVNLRHTVNKPYAECVLTRRNITGYVIMVDGDAVD